MKIFRLFSKDNFSRAIVVASNAEEALHTRPDERAVWRHGEWLTLGGGMGGHPKQVACPEWPDDIERVDVVLVGELTDKHCPHGVLAFQRDTQLRRPSEGPDESWGALFSSLKSKDDVSEDAKAVQQLESFHGRSLPAPDVGRICLDRLANMAAHSALIDLDLLAADGHEEAIFDLADLDVLRQLVHFAQKGHSS